MTTDASDRSQERLQRIRAALFERDCSAVICSRNIDVLLLSGYLPVTGAAIAIATAEPRVDLLVPEDEQERAASGWAEHVHTYRAATLDRVHDASDPLAGPATHALKALLPALGLQDVRVCCESGSGQVVSSYVAQTVLGGALAPMVRQAVPAAVLLPAEELMSQLRMRPTAWERERIRLACQFAAHAFADGVRQLRAELPEAEAALSFRNAFVRHATALGRAEAADAFVYCMSGPNAAHAWAAFQQSRGRHLQEGEPILVHCNAHVDGYWTDLTRTYVLGRPDARLASLMRALVDARDAALAMIRPGTAAADVDQAARTVLTDRGYGAAFRHATGHGVGFTPIDHAERPRIHPHSPDMLEEGMVFNVEPGIYLPGEAGLRDCNMVAVTGDGHELLSPFQSCIDDWCIAE